MSGGRKWCCERQPFAGEALSTLKTDRTLSHDCHVSATVQEVSLRDRCAQPGVAFLAVFVCATSQAGFGFNLFWPFLQIWE